TRRRHAQRRAARGMSCDRKRALRGFAATQSRRASSGRARFLRNRRRETRRSRAQRGRGRWRWSRILKKRTAARMLSRTGLGRLFAALMPSSGILILNYHRIGDGSASPYDRELFSADAEAFDAQVARLARDCDVISPADIESVAGRRGRHVLLTFDDGYLDNYDTAFPILRRHGVQATFFIATGYIDRPRLPWWDEIAWLLRSTAAARLDLRPWLPAPLAPVDGTEAAIHAILRAY